MDRAATIGTFDGVHRGHVLVLEMLKQVAMERGLQPVAMTFDRHPLELIAPERAPGNLVSTRRKEQLIRAEGVTPIVLTFNEALRSMRAYEWLDHIYRKYRVRLLVVGYDNTFGSDGIDHSLADLKSMGDSIGLEILEAPEVPGVSSSKVRKAVKAGDIEKAIGLLGHFPEVEGKVISGFHVGSDIGFPTANLQVASGQVIPLEGVYASRAFVDDSEVWHPAMVNIGRRPTFSGTRSQSRQMSVEAHIIGLHEDLYGRNVRLEFIDRLRDEQKFDSVEDLVEQLKLDREATVALSRLG